MAHYKSDAEGKLHKYAGNSHKAYMPLGMIFASSVELDELNVKRLDGQSLTINGSYHQFCTWIISRGNKVPTCDIDTYATEMSTYGQCGKFVINNTSSAQTSGSYTVPAYSIKLPTITEFVASNNGGKELGLAQLDEFKSHSHTQQTSTKNDGSNYYSVEPPQQLSGWWTKHSGGSTLATGGDETRPKNIRYPYYIVVAQGVKPIALADMTKKAEKDGSNLTNADVESWQKKLISGQYTMVPSANKINNIVDFTKSKYDHAVYTAPANGFVFIFYNGSSVDLWVRNNTTGYEMIFPNRTNASVLMPVAKGDKVQFYSTNAGNTTYSWSAFYYAKE